MDRYKFGMGSASDDPHHAIPFTPTASVRAQFRDFAGEFQSRDVLWSVGRRSVSTRPLQEVCAIQRGTTHPYEDFVRPGLRSWNILDFQHLGTTETSNNNSFHRLISTKPAFGID
jgi:hypothetical protein